MVPISPELEAEIFRRVKAENWESPEQFLRAAIDNLEEVHLDMSVLEAEILKGLEGESVVMTREEWAKLDAELEAEWKAECDSAHAA